MYLFGCCSIARDGVLLAELKIRFKAGFHRLVVYIGIVWAFNLAISHNHRFLISLPCFKQTPISDYILEDSAPLHFIFLYSLDSLTPVLLI